jgi:hypothetical protein
MMFRQLINNVKDDNFGFAKLKVKTRFFGLVLKLSVTYMTSQTLLLLGICPYWLKFESLPAIG